MGLIILGIELLIAICVVIFTLGFLAIKIIPLAIRLIKIQIQKAEEYAKRKEKQQYTTNRTFNQKSNNDIYGTGWTWNEATKRWDPPANIKPEVKFHRPGPTYEEWKAEKAKQEINSTPKNSSTEQGTYRYDYFHVPSDQQHFTKPKEQSQKEEPIPKRKTGYEEAYEAVPILTYNESRNFRALKEAADRKGFMICPKVRLADIVNPRKGSNYYSYFGKIKSKHVDFTICDYNMKVIAVVELDDSSHDRPDRQERDEFVDSILESNGIKVIHTRHITPDILDNL